MYTLCYDKHNPIKKVVLILMPKKHMSFRVEEKLYIQLKKEYFKMLENAIQDEEIYKQMIDKVTDTELIIQAMNYAIYSLREVNKK